MESFWTDTPFGIAILGGGIPTVVAGLVLSGIRLQQLAVHHARAMHDWGWVVAWLVGYGFMMVLVSYLAILVWYVSMTPIVGLWQLTGRFSYGLLVLFWLGPALWLFRSIFRPVWQINEQ